MGDITMITTVQDYCDLFGIQSLHPLACVVDCDRMKPIKHGKRLYNLYAVLLKDTDCGAMAYGRNKYDYEEGTVLFAAPGQVMGSDDDGHLHQPAGWALVFHPDLLRGTVLAKAMKEYTFFSYNAFEALHLSEEERQTIVDCMKKMQAELQKPVDKHTKALLVGHIKLLLDYCIRFYERQFASRQSANHDVLTRFENLLDEFYASPKLSSKSLLSVQYCADKLCLSANYLSDLLKRETGLSALKHIQLKMLDVAKERVLNPSKTVSQVAFELGFPYPQHFSRWFKKMTGCTPNDYRTPV